MRNLGRVPAQAIGLLLLILCLSGCGPLIAAYSLDAYKNATSLKAETLAMIDKSAEPYSKHAAEVDALNIKIGVAYEFVAGMPGNDLSAQQWAILKDSNGRLYGGFVAFWKGHGIVSKNFRDGVKKNIGEAFDQIICLEANKQALTSCSAATAAAQSDKH